jgi:hypothetical protein
MQFPGVDHVYILCRPDKEPDRAAYLQKWLNDNRIDPAQYTLGMATYGDDPFFQSKDLWTVYDPWTTQYGRTVQNFNSRNLKPGELSLLMNFAAAAKAAVAAKYTTVMILESDVLFCEKFLDRLQTAMSALPPTWEFLSLSASAGLVPKDLHPHQLWYSPLQPYFHTRCTDSMIFRVTMLEKILQTFFPFAEPLDWELNFQLSLHKAHSLWLHPPILRQGSGVGGTGVYSTTL